MKEIEDKNMKEYVILLGEMSNPYPVISKSKSLVLTSHFESFALVLVEAMACGSVPIAVDCPYGPRDVLENGKYGLLVPPNDATELAEAMYKIVTDNELYNSYLSVLNQGALRYDLKKVLNEWEDLFETY
jgi:glycosyltransferase involved in cell wall biosynthesis